MTKSTRSAFSINPINCKIATEPKYLHTEKKKAIQFQFQLHMLHPLYSITIRQQSKKCLHNQSSHTIEIEVLRPHMYYTNPYLYTQQWRQKEEKLPAKSYRLDFFTVQCCFILRQAFSPITPPTGVGGIIYGVNRKFSKSKNHGTLLEVFGVGLKTFNPLLSILNYETVEIAQKMILYSSSNLCAIRDRPHPLINMENYIPY